MREIGRDIQIEILEIGQSLKCSYSVILENNLKYFRKILILNESPWNNLFLKEIEFYKGLSLFPALEKYIPKLVAYDIDNYRLDIEYIGHDVKFIHRYIEDFDHAFLADIFSFSSLCTLYKTEYLESHFDKGANFLKLKKSNLFSANVLDFFFQVSESINELYLCNGDFLPKNILLTKANGRVVIIDWEFFGFKPRYYDLALLYISIRNESIKADILKFAKQNDYSTFLYCLALHLVKEIKIHTSDEGIKYELSYLYNTVKYLEESLVATLLN